MIFLSASLKREHLPGRDNVFFSWSLLPLAKCLARNRCSINVYWLNLEEPECIRRKVSRVHRKGEALESRSHEELGVCGVSGGCSGQDNGHPKMSTSSSPEPVNMLCYVARENYKLQVGLRLLTCWPEHQEIIVDYPSAQCNHSVLREAEGSWSEQGTWWQKQRLEWRGHKPRNAGSL